MSSYFSISLNCTFDSLKKFFESKEWNYELKEISYNKAFLKITYENIQELKFFINTENENKIKYEDLIEITEREYNTIDDSGFELIPKEVQKSFDKNIRTRINESNEVPEIKPFETRPITFRDTVTDAINEAIMPSKSPISNDDPFNFFLSKDYLRLFLLASSMIVFALSLFD